MFGLEQISTLILKSEMHLAYSLEEMPKVGKLLETPKSQGMGPPTALWPQSGLFPILWDVACLESCKGLGEITLPPTGQPSYWGLRSLIISMRITA